jgi:2-haloalkanoic acid dehalogenase type II
MKLTPFKVLSFDCYGTLIDWESGIEAALRPTFEKNNLQPTREEVLEAFAAEEPLQQQSTPTASYPDILAGVYERIMSRFNLPVDPEAQKQFAGSVKHWPAFPDTVEALNYLKHHYKLVVLSNIDKATFTESQKHLQVEFDAVLTAEEAGAYKPDLKMFGLLLGWLQANRYSQGQLLHVAHSLYHDHEPAKALGLSTVWIDRRSGIDGTGATPSPSGSVTPDRHEESLANFIRGHSTERKLRRLSVR